jgi:hypothetical protein
VAVWHVSNVPNVRTGLGRRASSCRSPCHGGRRSSAGWVGRRASDGVWPQVSRHSARTPPALGDERRVPGFEVLDPHEAHSARQRVLANGCHDSSPSLDVRGIGRLARSVTRTVPMCAASGRTAGQSRGSRHRAPRSALVCVTTASDRGPSNREPAVLQRAEQLANDATKSSLVHFANVRCRVEADSIVSVSPKTPFPIM